MNMLNNITYGQMRGPRLKVLLRPLMAVLMTSLLVACADDSEDIYVARDVEVLYHLGADRVQRGQYSFAAIMFDEVERQHPYSVWARRAMLMAAFAHYEASEYDDAVLAAERFLSLHPGNASAPYAHYLIAISYYEQINDVGRDQRVTEQAMDALEEVIDRYPSTDYARDAGLKLDMTRDHLAGKELDVGRFYQNQGQYLAGIGRFRNVVAEYQTTTHVQEALHRLVESYLAIGLEQEAQNVAAVLGHNYPDSKWYRYSYALLTDQDLEPQSSEGGFWLARVFEGIF